MMHMIEDMVHAHAAVPAAAAVPSTTKGEGHAGYTGCAPTFAGHFHSHQKTRNLRQNVATHSGANL